MEFFIIIIVMLALSFFVWIGFKKNKDNHSEKVNKGTTKRVR
jgi:hypothetical protein